MIINKLVIYITFYWIFFKQVIIFSIELHDQINYIILFICYFFIAFSCCDCLWIRDNAFVLAGSDNFTPWMWIFFRGCEWIWIESFRSSVDWDWQFYTEGAIIFTSVNTSGLVLQFVSDSFTPGMWIFSQLWSTLD